MIDEIATAVAALPPGVLQEADLRRCVDPLFARVLRGGRERNYLANHSLGRPLDRTDADMREFLSDWYEKLDEAWPSWQAEIAAFRMRVARLIGAPRDDCIAPKTSAGQGLRAVLNCYDRPIRVVTTRSEFNSVDFILKSYAAGGRLHIDWVEPRGDRRYYAEDIIAKLADANLLVMSLVFFDTGQFMPEAGAIVAAAQSQGAAVLLDLYHAAGALPVDIRALGADFAIGGSYKYLRGGPGAAWLYIHPLRLDSMRTLDTGWFASAQPFGFARAGQAYRAAGGDGWLESTPAIAPFYQARAGLEFTLAIGVDRLRAYSILQQAHLEEELSGWGVRIFSPREPRGAFVCVPAQNAHELSARLARQGLVVDARENMLRLSPDILNTPEELAEAARRVASALAR